MTNSNKILIAKITSTHGVRGQVKVMSFADNPEDLKNYQPLFNEKDEEIELKITSKPQGKNHDIFIASIKGFNNINEVEHLKNTQIFINCEQLPAAKDGEFYNNDLIGLDVIDEENNKIGTVKDVVNYGASDIVEIIFIKDFTKNDDLDMFAFCEEIFPEINLEKGFVKIILPEIEEIKW